MGESKEPSDAPEWARFFPQGQYPRFVATVEAELRRRGFGFRLDDGVAHIERQAQPERAYGLQNLAQKCFASGDEAAWPGVAAQHFQSMLDAEKDHADLAERAKSLDGVREQLKVRLYPSEMLTNVPDGNLVHRTPADGLLAVLAIDLPTTVATVSAEQRAAWPIDDDALFALALSNVLAQDPPTVEDVDLGKRSRGRALVGDSFFIASHLLCLERHFDRVPARGLVVAVPHRHALIAHAIEDMGVIDAINGLLPMAMGMFREGPGSVSPHLYWARGRDIITLPSKLDGGGLQFYPDPRFVSEVLEPLAAAGKS